MKSKVAILGHPVHPMLVAFPITFYVSSVAALVVIQLGGRDVFWSELAYFCTLAGLGTAVLAAVPGLVELLLSTRRDSDPRNRGIVHGSLNVAALLPFVVNAEVMRGTWGIRFESVGWLLLAGLLGCALTVAAAMQGWSLVAIDRLGVGPDLRRLGEAEAQRNDQRNEQRNDQARVA